MKNALFIFLALLFTSITFAQDLPTNPEPGKCYVRCVTPDVWRNEEVTVTVSPAYKKLKTIPAKYETVTEEVITQQAGQRLEVVPAKYEMRNVEVVVKEASQRLVKIPARTETQKETVVVKEASQRLELIPAKYETQKFEVVVQPASQKLKMIPAKYETQKVTVVTEETSQRLEVVPAEWGTETISYRKREFGSSLRVIPASFENSSETIETRPKTAKWEMGDVAPDCASSDPNDCRTWCYKNVPAQFQTVSTTVLKSDATSVRTPDCDTSSDPDCGMASYTKKIVTKPASTRVVEIPSKSITMNKTVMVSAPKTEVIEIPAVTKTMERTVMVTPPSTRVIEIPAVTKTVTKTIIIPESTRVEEIPAVTKTVKKRVMVTPPTTRVIDIPQKTGTIKKTVLVSDSKVVEETVPAVTKTVTKEILDKKGGLTVWREIECKLVEYNPLPINWNLGSATLTSGAKRIIDERLLPLLRENEGASIEIASHTDSRGSKSSNQALSERRAQAVTNYLISKGINNSRLVANGYGETRLKNRCSDGVSCTEREHADNRRTEFRFISQ